MLKKPLKNFRNRKWAGGNERVLQVSIISQTEVDRLCHADGEEWHIAHKESVNRRDRVGFIIGDYEPDGKAA